MYDRRNVQLRKQYKQLTYCYATCKGQEYGCSQYVPYKDQGCMHYVVILKDIKKIGNKDEKLTFPLLEKIVKDCEAEK